MCCESVSVAIPSRFDLASQSPRKPVVGRMSECGRAIVAAQPSVLQTTSAPLIRSEGRSDRLQLGLMNRRSHSARASPDRPEQVVREKSTSSAPASLLPSRAPSSEGVRCSSARPHLHRKSVGLPSIFKVPGHLLHHRLGTDCEYSDDSVSSLISPDSSLVQMPELKFPFKEPADARRAPSGVTAARARCLGLRPRLRGAAKDLSPRDSPMQMWSKSSWPSQNRSSVVSNASAIDRKTAFLSSVAEDVNDRPYMEDGCRIYDLLPLGDGARESWGYYAVFDGHGGSKIMQYCEERLHHLVAAELAAHHNPDHNTVRSCITRAFKKADDEVSKLDSQMTGSTATVALARRLPHGGVELHVGNVGDSRALLVSSSGTKRLTEDHRSTDPAEAARVRQRGGFICQNRVGGSLGVTRSIGDHYLKPGVSCEPDVIFHNARASDETVGLVIASDGLWDAVGDDEVQDILTDHLGAVAGVPDEQKAAALTGLEASVAKTLVQRAKAQGSRDNIVVLVAFF